jgi:hypothetical protein
MVIGVMAAMIVAMFAASLFLLALEIYRFVKDEMNTVGEVFLALAYHY